MYARVIDLGQALHGVIRFSVMMQVWLVARMLMLVPIFFSLRMSITMASLTNAIAVIHVAATRTIDRVIAASLLRWAFFGLDPAFALVDQEVQQIVVTLLLMVVSII